MASFPSATGGLSPIEKDLADEKDLKDETRNMLTLGRQGNTFQMCYSSAAIMPIG